MAITALTETDAIIRELDAAIVRKDAQLAAMRETGNVMAEELEFFADFARRQAEFEGDIEAAEIAIHAWQYATVGAPQEPRWKFDNPHWHPGDDA